MATSTDKSKEQSMEKHPDSVKFREADKELVSSIKGKLEAVSTLKSIFRVPEKLQSAREKVEKVYVPDKIAIGPFHHGEESLEGMQEHKWHYLYTLLSRKPNLEAILFKCVKALRELEQTARNCYAESLILTSNAFVEMMLLDGCFIIELFFKYAIKDLRRRGDPIFTTSGLFFDIRCNLILLENQIPLIILQRLFEIVPIPTQCNLSLGELAYRFFRNMLPGDKEVLSEKFTQEGNHLLDLIHQCYLPTYAKVQSKEAASPTGIESATKFQKHNRIEFMRIRAKSLLDIKFEDGILEIAPLRTHKFTEILFANLIALEQHQTEIQYFTSYALLMAAFIQSEKDVKLFRHLRIFILDNGQNEKDICDLFVRLCKEVNEKEFYYSGLLEQIKEYKKRGRLWKLPFKGTCLKTPTAT